MVLLYIILRQGFFNLLVESRIFQLNAYAEIIKKTESCDATLFAE